MSLFNNLAEFVTPHVLTLVKNHTGSDSAKSSLLNTFYPLFVGQLSNEGTFQKVSSLLGSGARTEPNFGARLLETVFGQKDGVNQLTDLSANLASEYQLPADTVNELTTTAAPAVLSRLQELAGDKSLPAYLSTALSGESFTLPAWATSLLPAGLLGGAAVLGANKLNDTHTTTTTTSAATPTAAHIDTKTTSTAPLNKHHKEEKSGGFLKSLLPIIGLIIFAGLAWLLLKSCQDKPAPVAAPVANNEQPANQDAAAGTDTATAAALAPATLSLATDSTGAAIDTCRTEVGSADLLGKIRAAVANVFGTNNCDSINAGAGIDGVSQNAATDMPSIDQLPAILGLMKGVPNASVDIAGKDITFNADKPETITKLVEAAKAALPADFNITAAAPLDANAAVASSIDAARNAIGAVTGTDAASAEGVVKALNMQIINFASDSTDIPAENKEILDLAAEKLSAIADTKLAITGHTDSQGDHAYNQKLSESRAAAVRDYLVSKGVDTARMTVNGASSDNPVATNATEQGRFKNRRIEFTVSKDGEVVGEAGKAPAQ